MIATTNGSLPSMSSEFIPNCIPHLTGRELAYVTEAISRNEIAVGSFINRFEAAIRDFTGARHAVALSTGTASVHLALLAADVKPGDLVLTPALTFAATANAIRYCGADPVFIDSDEGSWGMSIAQTEAFLARCKKTAAGLIHPESGRAVSAMLPVHLYGHPADLGALYTLASRFGIALVEDAAEALGAKYNDRPIGTDSRYCALSFNGNKIITGGSGGMVLTDDPGVEKRVRHLANQAKAGDLQFEHDTVGYNYRMPNLNAAVLCAQAEMLGSFVNRKREIVARYHEHLADLNHAHMFRELPWAKSSYWMALLCLEPASEMNAEQLIKALAARKVQARPAWMPLQRQLAYSGAYSEPTPVADRIHSHAICLPCSVGITDDEIARAAAAIRDCISTTRPKLT